MLRVFSSNRTERLVRQWLIRVVTDGPASVFEPVEVVVPSAGLRRYLTLATADTLGICANLRFDFLASWQWRMIRRVLPGVPDASPFAAPRLTWRVYRAFGDAALVGRHPRLGRYLAEADPAMRLDLATRVATLFEQYLTYRQDWLVRWRAAGSVARDAGETGGRLGADTLADEAWQADLWRWLNRDLGVGTDHPADAFLRELERAGPGAARHFGLPSRVHLFGLPDIAPLNRDIMVQLGRWLDVDVYLLDPCAVFWHDIESPRRLARLAARGRADGVETGNRLLASWGRQTRGLVAGLASATDAISGLDAFEAETGFAPNEAETVLARLQNSILDLEDLEPGSIELDPFDRSLELHVCHSLTRELEVVQDRLLGLFAADPTLAPGDVLVAVPDIDAAAPLIEAVFGTAPAPRRLPFTISGRAARDGDGPTRAVTSVLDLALSRVTATGLFSVLQQPIVGRRFGFDDDTLEQLHQWLLDAGFRWGLDARHRATFGVPASRRHTLADALERLLLGFASPDAMPTAFADQVAVGGAEGADALGLGALARFRRDLAALRATLAEPRLPADWGRCLQAVVDDFLSPDRDQRAATRELRETIASVVADMVDGGVDEPLPFGAVRAALLRAFAPGAPGAVAGGAITFTGLSQLRAIPFRVVCLLGLDHGAFPKPARPAEFDLMAAMPRAGDRQRRDDDRNLFLDLVLATRDVLHLSHTGRSVVDNSPLPPSAVVSELLDVLLPAVAEVRGEEEDEDEVDRDVDIDAEIDFDAAFDAEIEGDVDADSGAGPGLDAAEAGNGGARREPGGSGLVIEHPLQPFAAAAFRIDGDARRRSHDADYARALAEAAREAGREAVREAARAAAEEAAREASLEPARVSGRSAVPSIGIAPAFGDAPGNAAPDSGPGPTIDGTDPSANATASASGDAPTNVPINATLDATLDAADDSASDAADGDEVADDPAARLPRFVTRPVGPAPVVDDSGDDATVLSIDDLVAFFRNPADAFLRQRLGVDLERERAVLLDDEPILAGHGETRALASRLLPSLIDGSLDREGMAVIANAAGDWPEGLIGSLTLPPALAELADFADRVRSAAPATRTSELIDLELEVDGTDWRLTGIADTSPGQGLIRWSFHDLGATDVLELWIRHLALLVANGADEPIPTEGIDDTGARDPRRRSPIPAQGLLSRHLGRDQTLELADVADPRQRLVDLIRLRDEGLARPLPFYPKAAWALVGRGEKLESVSRKWLASSRQPHAESGGAAVRLVRRGLVARLDDAFIDCAHRVFMPVREAMASRRAGSDR